MEGVFDLAILVRCHDYPEFVLDTVDALFYHCTTCPLIVVSADRNESICKYVKKHYPQVVCYSSSTRYGWGAGLYTLWCETIDHIDKLGYKYRHVMSVDYDAVPIRRGADEILLQYMDRHGLVGRMNDGSHWMYLIQKSIKKLNSMGFSFIDKSFSKSILGAVMCMSEDFVKAMKSKKLLDPPLCRLKDFIKVTDDAWFSTLCQVLGFELCDIRKHGEIHWRGAVRPSVALSNKSIYWYHPTKQISGGSKRRLNNASEIACRNAFRSSRSRSPLILPAYTTKRSTKGKLR